MGISSSSQKTTRDPAAFAKPYITDSLSQLQTGANTASANVAKYMPDLNSAIQGITSRMNTPPAYETDARTQLDKTINGDYLGQNPYASAMADQIGAKTGANYAAAFGKSGRANGGLSSLLSTQGIGDALNSFYGNQYATERGLQQQAIGAAPAFHQDDNSDISPLLSAINGSATLPMAPAQNYANTVTAATSPYVTDTQKQTQAWGPAALGAALAIGGAAAGVPPGLMGGAGGSSSPSFAPSGLLADPMLGGLMGQSNLVSGVGMSPYSSMPQIMGGLLPQGTGMGANMPGLSPFHFGALGG